MTISVPRVVVNKTRQLLDNYDNDSHIIKSMPSLDEFRCRTEANKCVIDMQLSDRKNPMSVVLDKQQLKDMTEGMAAIRQQLFDATHKSD
ncbi:unnamed protein product [Oppiella nova]|uniref:Uncharacterized protein n=1 Tax=Oppiella nova TaxID=334625 RepID=A0A7R9QZ94_9ACAR|nr:unnamed protein product [Oppiella nova]CAG2179928.1 unnamed protein product [Oppiella nova]